MARHIHLLRTALFSAGIAGALTFGASSLLASPGNRACGDPAAHGSCSGWYACEKICERFGYDPNQSFCVNGCCYCE